MGRMWHKPCFSMDDPKWQYFLNGCQYCESQNTHILKPVRKLNYDTNSITEFAHYKLYSVVLASRLGLGIPDLTSACLEMQGC